MMKQKTLKQQTIAPQNLKQQTLKQQSMKDQLMKYQLMNWNFFKYQIMKQQIAFLFPLLFIMFWELMPKSSFAEVISESTTQQMIPPATQIDKSAQKTTDSSPKANSPNSISQHNDFALSINEQMILTPHLQYRPRYLLHGGKDFGPGNTYDAFSHRARLGLKAELFRWFSVMLEVQDVRRWGEEINTLSDFTADGLDMHQAWIEIGCPLGVSLRIGRQELIYDNHRLIGNVDWTDQGRSFDGLRLALHRGNLHAHLFYAKVGEQDVYLPDSQDATQTIRGSVKDIDLAGIWLKLKRWPWAQPSLLAIYDGGAADDHYRLTAGFYLDGSLLSSFTYTAEFYFQGGAQKMLDGSTHTISAFLGALGISYTFPLKLQPTIGAWFDYLSGDSNPSDDKNTVFDTLFATNHKFYGYMDLFLNLPKDTYGLGLIDAGARIKIHLHPKVLAYLDWHLFNAAQKSASAGRSFGNEIDTVLSVKLNSFFAVEAVFGTFFPGQALKELRKTGSAAELYGYLQTDLKF